LKLSRQGWTGLATLVASLVLFALTLDLKSNPLVPIGPGFYPRIVLGLTAALAAALVVFDWLAARQPAPSASRPNYELVACVFVIVGLYVGALPFLGFRISTFLFVAALQATLDPPRTARAWFLVGVSALITTAASYVLFERYLQVLLPRGRWTGF
jgi:putative tricarboxylic transport membrane protein